MSQSSNQVVNPIPAEEIPGWARAMDTTFLRDPDGPHMRRRIDQLRRAWDPGRAWGAGDRGRWVATLRSGRGTFRFRLQHVVGGKRRRRIAKPAIDRPLAARRHPRPALLWVAVGRHGVPGWGAEEKVGASATPERA